MISIEQDNTRPHTDPKDREEHRTIIVEKLLPSIEQKWLRLSGV